MVTGAPGSFWGQKALQGELTTLADMKEQVNYKASFMISIIALQSWTWLREKCNEVQFSAWLAAIIEESAAPKCSGLAVERTHSSPTVTQAYSEICPQPSAGRLGSALSIFQERGWGHAMSPPGVRGLRKVHLNWLGPSCLIPWQQQLSMLSSDCWEARNFPEFFSFSESAATLAAIRAHSRSEVNFH